MNKFIIVNILILLFFAAGLKAQNFHTKSNRALKSYTEGKRAYDYINYTVAEKHLLDATEKDNGFIEAYLLLAELYKDQKRYNESLSAFESALRIDTSFFLPALYNVGEVNFLLGKYSEAQRAIEIFLSKNPESPILLTKSKKYLQDCEFALEAILKPVQFQPVSLGDSVNTKFDEYWPAISIDDKLLLFTRQVSEGARNVNGIRYQEDFYISTFSDSSWGKARSIGSPLNTRANEGALSLEAGGQYMYFTACNRPDGKGGCDIYYSARTDRGWLPGQNVASPINTNHWESQPSLSSDGSKLFFVSNRPGGYGGMDIWVSNYSSEGRWSDPVNLGSDINTNGDEMSPYIHFDGKTIYFSSNGRPSMGGFDIFMATMISDTIWTDIKNLGYPINTQTDEIGLIINSSGKKAYFSSKINSDKGRDLFSFDLPEEFRPESVSYVKGTVVDSKTRRRLQASYELINLSINEIVLKSSTNSDGEFLICLTPGQNYGLNVDKSKYLFYSENFFLEGIHSVSEPYLKEIGLNRIRVGEKMSLYNVFFATDSWKLMQESTIELTKLKNLIIRNDLIIIEVGGHTDSSGTDEHNMDLSEKRAAAVRDFLVANGISSERITYKGYGDTQPVSDNETNEGRRRNRRVDISIIGTIQEK